MNFPLPWQSSINSHVFSRFEVVLYKRLYHYFLHNELLYCMDRSLTGLGVIANDKNSQALQLT